MTIFDSIKYPIPDDFFYRQAGSQLVPMEMWKEFIDQIFLRKKTATQVEDVALLRKIIAEWP